MNIIWKFVDRNNSFSCSSFPYAYRTMHHAWRRELEGFDQNKNPCPKRSPAEMMKSFSIIGPCGTKMERKYSYHSARAKALENGLIDAEGNLNGKEFKKQRY